LATTRRIAATQLQVLQLALDLPRASPWRHDCHTRAGKKRGKTKADFFKAEQAALQPFQPGLFDHLIES